MNNFIFFILFNRLTVVKCHFVTWRRGFPWKCALFCLCHNKSVFFWIFYVFGSCILHHTNVKNMENTCSLENVYISLCTAVCSPLKVSEIGRYRNDQYYCHHYALLNVSNVHITAKQTGISTTNSQQGSIAETTVSSDLGALPDVDTRRRVGRRLRGCPSTWAWTQCLFSVPAVASLGTWWSERTRCCGDLHLAVSAPGACEGLWWSEAQKRDHSWAKQFPSNYLNRDHSWAEQFPSNWGSFLGTTISI